MVRTRLFGIVVLSGMAVIFGWDMAMGGPDVGTLVGDTGTFVGDQHSGVVSGVDFTSPPVTVLNVNTLLFPITPASGIPGIYLFNGSGAGLTVNSGDSAANIIIDTLGNNAYGIYAVSEGAPASYDWAAGLGILEPDGPSGAGGPVELLSYSDIMTTGSGAHGIVAQNRIGVYNPFSILSLEAFSTDDVTTYLTSVSGSAANVGTPVAGDNGGVFTLYANGAWDFDASDMNDMLAVGETAVTKVDYEIEIEHEPGTFLLLFPYGSQYSDGSLSVRVTKTGDGLFDVVSEVYFDEFDSYSLSDGQAPVLWPDLQDYVDRLRADMGIAGAGESILVRNNGTITTTGIGSHGIFTQTVGGQGYHGRNGSFWDAGRIPTQGGPGSNGGGVTVINNGEIVTDANSSVGILMVSTGGQGGHGGNGSDWRYGRPGGVGGTGGTLTVAGSGGIQTEGDYASGILALSEGGVGGVGGEGVSTTGGGGGGFGGKGGAINIAGNWEIATKGDKAHAIWAKSVGGSAGVGGSGGWLFGDPGVGGVGSDGGRVEVVSGGSLTTWGDDSYGIYAESVGGFGGSGGTSYGFFWAFGGDGGSGGSGGDVVIANQVTGEIITYGAQSHAIFGQSIGGGGGSGGGEFGLFASLGGEGNAGGHGGIVEITNEGLIQTFGYRSRGIYAQSIGGGGGDGGSSTGLVAIGGDGAGTSNGGPVSVVNSGMITTAGEKSHAIFAESVGGGGGDGGDSGGLVSIGGDGGDGGNGSTVGVFNSGQLATDQNESSGIFAQSVGGGGGNGGDSVSIGGPIATVSIGGGGGAGGYSSKVDITNSGDGDINTLGDRSFGIFAQSVGGGGGNGGFAVSAGLPTSLVNLAIGGRGGGGGDGNDVEVHNEGTITTSGREAHGVFAQSVGGGGGSGGFAVSGNLGGAASLQLALGGAGGLGGDGDAVDVGTELNPLQGSIVTSGERSYGILAQSVGGGGGDGGFAIAGSGLTGTSLNLAFGGDGGGGGVGGVVSISSLSNISTDGNDAHALIAQSVGGGGGSGGFSLAASYGGGTGLNFSFGGEGGTGNAGGMVTVGTDRNPLQGTITTSGDRAYGVLAQSLGGGGGSGGMSISGQLLGGQTIGFAFGGDGGNGGLGGPVNVESASNIVTDGKQSHGLLAQSVGGGGGAGGFSLTAAVTAFGGFNMSTGGDGGLGNSGGTVDVNNLGSILTLDEYSHGIVAQSIGGGGGAGGASGSVMVNFSSLIPVPPEIPITGSANFAVSVGGDGGYGGAGGAVNVNNVGWIDTYEDFSIGIFGQSVGGGGGDGGKSVAATANISLPEGPSEGDSQPQMEVQVDFALAIGGDGGNGNSGGSVDIVNSGAIGTLGDSAHAISGQSIGGGGGRGGDARSMTLSIDPSNWLPTDPPPSPTSISQALNISIGGDAGWGNNGGIVTVANDGDMITGGADAYGIFAQSIGGGGGEGGGGYHGLDWEDLGVPDDIAPFLDLAPIEENSNIQIIVGGQGGSGGDGNNVNVVNTGNIITLGDGSTAVLAQSIGAGGGMGGVGAHGSGTVGIGGCGGAAGDGGEVIIDISGNIDTYGVAAGGIFAQSIGGGGGIAGNVDGGVEEFGMNLNLGVGQNGGNAGDGGDVNIASEGNITTRDDASTGIFAQSIGGGGGLTGDISTGMGFAGSVGGDGSGGDITIVHDGDIETFGDNSHGIFAQSAGGQNDTVSQSVGLMDAFGNLLRDPSGDIIFGPLIPLVDRPDLGGAVDVKVTGDIKAYGAGSHGIFAQSVGDDGNGNTSVTISSGTVQGGSGSGVGVYMADGASNMLTNSGNILALSGTAIVGGTGNETIDNYGTVTGNVDLMTGSNGFNNYSGGVFNAGPDVYLGVGRLLSNSGTVSSGGAGTAQTTALMGDFSQSDFGTYHVDLDFGDYEPDKLDVSGVSNVNGEAYFSPVNGGWAAPGTHEWTVLSSSGGITNLGLVAAAAPSAVIGYELLWPDATNVGVRTNIDFAPAGLSRNQAAIANAVNSIQSSGGSEAFAPFAAELLGIPNVESLGDAYDQLSGESYGAGTVATFGVTQQYTQTLVKRMHSVRSSLETTGNMPGLSQKEEYAVWIDGFGLWNGDQDASDGFTGFKYSASGVGIGLDWLIDDGFLAGISFGQSYSSIQLDNRKGSGDIKSLFGSIYGSRFSERRYLDFAFSYGHQSFGNSRRIEVGELTRVAKSDHHGDLYSAYVEAGRNYDIRRYILQPFAALHYMYLDERGYNESGAPGVNLLVDDRYTSSLISDLGVRFYLPFERKQETCIPEVTIAWRHDYDVDDRNITAAFDGAPAVGFTTEGDDRSKDGLIVGCGLTLLNKKGVSINVRYSGEVRSDYRSHMVYGGLRWEFK